MKKSRHVGLIQWIVERLGALVGLVCYVVLEVVAEEFGDAIMAITLIGFLILGVLSLVNYVKTKEERSAV